MAELIKTVTLTFDPSGSPDVSGYALYIEEAPAPVTRDSQRIDLGNPAPDSTSGKIAVDLSTLPDMTTKDGTYNLAIATIDKAGNESSLLTEGLQDIVLDFAAPDPPTNASVSYS